MASVLAGRRELDGFDGKHSLRLLMGILWTPRSLTEYNKIVHSEVGCGLAHKINRKTKKTTDSISRWSRKTSWRWRESKGGA